jgi:hypothetical protein
VGKIGSANPYVYADNVPTMQVDPSGRATCIGQLTGGIPILLGSVVAILALLAAPVTTLGIIGLVGAILVFGGTYTQVFDILNSCQATGTP